MNNPELELAWRLVETTGANLFLTGKAGTGKTTFLKNLRSHSSKRMVVLAPTGIAAINAEGVTIHSFFQLPLSPYMPGMTYDRAERRYFKFGRVKRDIIRTLDLLVIDEISMVRADLLDAVDAVMRRYRDHDKPFGGAQLLMIGDLQQLAPVVKDEEWMLLSRFYDTPYFFSSKALAQASYNTIELKQVFRQQDSSFVALLNQIRENNISDAALTEFNRRYLPNFTPPRDSDYIRLVTHNYQALAINERELATLPSEEFSYRAEVEGVFPETSYPADQCLVLKRGAQVMFIKNDPDKRFFNGMIGEVVALDGRNITVRSKDGGEAFRLEKAEWTNSKYTLDDVSKEIKETVEGMFCQYPLRLAWAITIHKSQGLTFDHAIIDVSHSFAHGQAYVALSRCRTLDGLVLSAPLQREAMITDDIVDSFVESIDEHRPTDNDISAMQQAYVVKLLDELFDFTGLQSSYNLLLRTLDEHLYRKYPKLLFEYKRLSVIFTDIIDVARKFKNQYAKLASDLSTEADYLGERVRKAAGYFSDKLSELEVLCGKTKVEIESKTVKKQFDDRFSVFVGELSLKIKLLRHEQAPGVSFAAADYLAAKAKILLSDSIGRDETEVKHNKKTKTPKPVKEPKAPKPLTREISFNMYVGGMTIEQIAEERGLTVGTVFSHLAHYASEGRMDWHDLISEESMKELQAYFAENGNRSSLSEIKSKLSPSVSYDEIRLFIDLNKKRKS